MQTGYTFTTPEEIKLAKRLADLTPGDLDKTYFANTGSESNEAALRMAKFYTGRDEIVGLVGGYHGLTQGSLAVTAAGSDLKRGYGSTVPGAAFLPTPNPYRCRFCRQNGSCNLTCLEYGVEFLDKTTAGSPAAIILEPILSSGGIFVPSVEYMREVRRICDERGALMILDEAQTGIGRSGKWFAIEHWDVVPDMITMAKGITSGYFPVGACAVRENIHEAFKGGPEATYPHGFTYGGHPVGAAVGLANIDIMEREGLVENSATMGEYLLDRLTPLKEHPTVGDVRGLGLISAVELVKDKATKEPLTEVPGAVKMIRDQLADRGMLTRVGREIFITPPLPVTKDDIDEMVDMVEGSITHAEKELGLS
jgi:4-aminobutyrate aminotransferase-like enzyme